MKVNFKTFEININIDANKFFTALKIFSSVFLRGLFFFFVEIEISGFNGWLEDEHQGEFFNGHIFRFMVETMCGDKLTFCAPKDLLLSLNPKPQ